MPKNDLNIKSGTDRQNKPVENSKDAAQGSDSNAKGKHVSTWSKSSTDASEPRTREALIRKAWANAVERWTQDGIVAQEGVVPPSSSAAEADTQNDKVIAAGEALLKEKGRELDKRFPISKEMKEAAYPVIELQLTDNMLNAPADKLVESYDNNGIERSIVGRYNKELGDAYDANHSSEDTAMLKWDMEQLGEHIKKRANAVLNLDTYEETRQSAFSGIKDHLKHIIKSAADDDTPADVRAIVHNFLAEIGLAS